MSDKFNLDVKCWPVLDSFFSEEGILTRHQTASFDDLVDYVIPQIIEKNNSVILATNYDDNLKDFRAMYKIDFLQMYFSKPLIQESNDVIRVLTAQEARLRGLTYEGSIFLDVRHTLILKDENGKEKILPDTPMTAVESKIPLSKLPVLLHSKYDHLSGRSSSSLSEMGECPYDQGGYFVVNGGEKVIVGQERVAENTVFAWAQNKSSNSKYSHEVEIKSSIDQRFYPVKTNKVKLTKEPTAKAIKDSLNKGTVPGRTLKVQMPYLKEDIPLVIMFRALGIVTDKEIYEMILYDIDEAGSNYTNLLLPSVEEARAKGCTTQENALKYISRQLNLTFNKDFQGEDDNVKLKYVKDILNRELLPHIGQNNRKKAFFLGHMTRKLMDTYFGVRPYDDRDHYSNKRVDLTGPLLTQLFRANFIKLIKDLRQQILPKLTAGMNGLYPSIRKVIQSCNIGAKMKYGLATGNWSTSKTPVSASKKGIAQVLNRLSYIGALSHTRRVQSPLERAGSKIVPPRRLHGTHFGMCCPNETPEGGQVGIVKNFSMQTHISIQTSDYPVRIALNELGVKDLSETVPSEVAYSTKIFVNGDWFGVINDRSAKDLHSKLRTLKRHGIIVPYISIAWYIEWKEIHIFTDGGRYCRPLLIAENNQLLIQKLYQENTTFRSKFNNGNLKWMEFLSGFFHDSIDSGDISYDNGAVIEYLDTNEIENSMIAMNQSDLLTNRNTNNFYLHYSHCEIHPMMMLGVVATMIPFSDRNPSPRNCYQSSMGKQAIGYFVTNYNSRMDTLAHVMVYGQRPLCQTRPFKYTLLDQLPHGAQPELLYAIYTGYNQEDSNITNLDSVERGFFNTIFFRTYVDKEQKHKSATTASEKFTRPNKSTTSGIKHGSTEHIDQNGVAKLGDRVEGGDVIIGKVIESKESDSSGFIEKDASTTVRPNESGVIDKVIPDPENKIHNYNAEGHKFIKVRLASLRKPEIGDKFASRHSQKGTVGMLYRSRDMPTTADGVVPDVIMNPHGIPSRMTAGMLLESLMGKLGVYKAEFQDATPFTALNLESVKAELKKYGCHEYGNEVLYNGKDGRMFDVLFFMAPTYYQRLKHMVEDKYHSREGGPVQLLTRQPSEGRSRDGGLRLGEMERDVLIGHGTVKLLKERTMESSDAFPIYISRKHKAFAVANPEKGIYKYNGQNIKDDGLTKVHIPYAMKLLLQEIESTGVDVQMETD